jgi:hypothetical protein
MLRTPSLGFILILLETWKYPLPGGLRRCGRKFRVGFALRDTKTILSHQGHENGLQAGEGARVA